MEPDTTNETIYGWDLSHYDTTPTLVDCHLAMQQGITFATHKLGEGLGNRDSTATKCLGNWRNAGLTLLGGYWFGHQADDPQHAAQACIDAANVLVPWWKDFPGWFWQADCETEGSNGKPSRAWIEAFCDALATDTGRVVLAYASHGEYGSIPGLGHPLWNANYGSDKPGEFKSLYPGNHSAGWNGYPDVPLILQYSSKATIAGHTTCDANAFRGTVADLTAIIEEGHIMADVTLSTETMQDIADQVLIRDGKIANPDPKTAAANPFVSLATWCNTIAAMVQAAPVPPAAKIEYAASGDITLTPKP